jgi:hypothetical protein
MKLDVKKKIIKILAVHIQMSHASSMWMLPSDSVTLTYQIFGILRVRVNASNPFLKEIYELAYSVNLGWRAIESKKAIEILRLLDGEGIITYNIGENKIQLNKDTFEDIFKDVMWSRSDFVKNVSDLVKVKSLHKLSANSLGRVVCHPDEFLYTNGCITIKDYTVNPMPKVNNRRALINKGKKAFKDQPGRVMSFIMDKDMDQCFGVDSFQHPHYRMVDVKVGECNYSSKVHWTPTKYEEQNLRIEIAVATRKRNLELAMRAEDQLPLLREVYDEHGQDGKFNDWVAHTLIEKIEDDPTGNLHHPREFVAEIAAACIKDGGI